MTKITIYDENPDINFDGLSVVDRFGDIVGTINKAELKGNAYICSVACNDTQNEFWKRFVKSMKSIDNITMGVRHGQKEKENSR